MFPQSLARRFALRQATRRRVLVVLFGLGCLLPTFLVLGFGLRRHLPWYASWEAAWLGTRLGLRAELQRVEHPWPGTVRYRGLKLSDPETGAALLWCDTLQVRRATSPPSNSPRAWCLETPEAEVEAAGLEELWRLVDRAMQGHVDAGVAPVRIRAGCVVLRHGSAASRLVQMEGHLETSSAGSKAGLAFVLQDGNGPGQDAAGSGSVPGSRSDGGSGPSDPRPAAAVRLSAVRSRQVQPPVTWLELSTGASALPCELLALGVPAFGRLGPGCAFTGRLVAGATAEGWAGELRGQFSPVQLDRLVSEPLPHQLTGQGTLVVKLARFRHSRLEMAEGSLEGGPGWISRSLVEASAQYLGCTPNTPANSPAVIPYEQLALYALVDSRGLHLWGQCPGSSPGTILTDRYGRLLGEPSHQPQPIAALLQTLVPASAVQVPATVETDWLMRLLPLPEVTSVAQPGLRAFR